MERDNELWDIVGSGWAIGAAVVAFAIAMVFVFAHLERPLNDIHRDAVTHSHEYIEMHIDQAQRLLSSAQGHEVKWQRAVAAGDAQTADDEQRFLAAAVANLRRENDKLTPSEQPASVVAYLQAHPGTPGY